MPKDIAASVSIDAAKEGAAGDAAERTRRPTIRPTLAGLGFLAMVLAGIIMAVNFSSNVIFAMTFLLLGVFVIGGWQTWQNATGLAAAAWRVDPTFAGEAACFRLTVREAGGRRHEDIGVACESGSHSERHSIQAEDSVSIELRRSTAQRGWMPSVPATLDSAYPLGLFAVRMTVPAMPRCLVYPAPADGGGLTMHTAAAQAQRQFEAETFDTLRRYVPGDRPGRIAWKALARTGELLTKTFDGAERRPEIWLRWVDTPQSDTEERLSQLTAWVLEAERRGVRYGLRLPGTDIDPGCGGWHRDRCLTALALFSADAAPADPT